MDEVAKRCSADDIKNLEEFDERNRVRAVRLVGVAQARVRDLGLDYSESVGVGVGGNDSGVGMIEGWGFNPDGSYPYLTLRYTHVPTYTERDELVHGVRPLFLIVDRVVRMAMAMERERERERLEAEEALRKRREDELEKETEDAERVEKEMKQEREKEEREREREEARKSVGAWVAATGNVSTGANASAGTIRIPPRSQPQVDTSAVPLSTSKKRSPHQAWANDDGVCENDEEDGDSEAKRLRLARSQSETWYEQERRLQQKQQTDSQKPPLPQSTSSSQSQSPFKFQPQPQFQSQPRSHSQSPRKFPPTHSRSQSQPTNFIPPEKQYPAPLSAYDPQLYPDAASVIESQSQSQGGRPGYYREDTPSGSESGSQQHNGEGGQGGSSNSTSGVGRGIGLGANGEVLEGEEDPRPNALKRSPKKGVKRGLTRGRTLVQIC